MSRSKRVPLHLFEALEEEFITLQGAPPEGASVVVKLPDPTDPHEFREVTASLNWKFHSSHIKNPQSLAASLTAPPIDTNQSLGIRIPGALFSYDWARNNLVAYLKTKIDPELLKALDATLRDPKAGPPHLKEWIATELNKLLEDPNLYDEDRFSSYWLGTASKALIESRESEEFKGDDLAHFNR